MTKKFTLNGSLAVATLGLSLCLAACSTSERRGPAYASPAPGYEVKQISDDTIQIAPGASLKEAAGANAAATNSAPAQTPQR
jgi:hypothetical protein